MKHKTPKIYTMLSHGDHINHIHFDSIIIMITCRNNKLITGLNSAANTCMLPTIHVHA